MSPPDKVEEEELSAILSSKLSISFLHKPAQVLVLFIINTSKCNNIVILNNSMLSTLTCKGIVAVLLAVSSIVIAHRIPYDSGDEDTPEVDGVERDLDNAWLLDKSILIFCMLFFFKKNIMSY